MIEFSKMQRIKPKSLSYYPYLFQFINSWIWIIFAFISYSLEKESVEFMQANIFLGVVGIIASSFYLIKYFELSQKSQKESLSDELSYTVGFIFFVGIISYFYVMEHQKYHTLLKKCSTITTIFMFSSSFANFKAFYNKNKISIIPKTMIICGSCFSCSLFIYSSFNLDDSQLWIPFMIGYALSCLQLAAVLVFPCFFSQKDLDQVNSNRKEKKTF